MTLSPSSDVTETHTLASEVDPEPEIVPNGVQPPISFPDNELGAALESHVYVAFGDGTHDYYENYFSSILNLKEFPDVVNVLNQLFWEQNGAFEKWVLVQILADLDECSAVDPLKEVGLRTHPPLGPAPCHGCEGENEFEVYATLRAITGLERLLSRSCATYAESALEAIALGAQSEAGRHQAVATLKIVAGYSQESLEGMLPSDEKWFAEVVVWDVEEITPPVPSDLKPPEEFDAPQRGF